MKKFYFILIALFATFNIHAQCVIDTAILDTAASGAIYPTAPHLPAIVQDSLYDQTVQGKMPTTMSFGGIATLTIDSVRMDSIAGLPTGINWIKNPNVIYGGGLGCVEFTGSTTDTVGTYPITGYGRVWGSITIPILGTTPLDTFISLNTLPPFRNYYLVVDSTQLPLSVTAAARNLCYGATNGSATATAVGGSPIAPYTYLWNNGVTSYTINNVTPGTYSVTVTSGTDTATTTVIIVAEPSPLALGTTADSSLTGNNGAATVTVSGGVPPYTYRWTPGGATTDSIDSLAPGTYMVTVRDSFGCTYRDSAVVYGITLGVNSVSPAAPQVTLFPNPANNLMNVLIESPQTAAAHIEAVDMTGRIVYSAPITIGAHYNLVLNLTDFSSGVYLLQLSSETQSVHQRFVVTH